jgi:benzoyl-CoA reductase subunit D
MREAALEAKSPLELRAHPQSVLAGALGAALWGAFRARRMAREGAVA